MHEWIAWGEATPSVSPQPHTSQAPTSPSTPRGLCSEPPTKHHFNSTDKSPSRNHHPGRDKGRKPVTKPETRRMCGDSSPWGGGAVKGLFVSRDRCPRHPQTKRVCSPARGWDGFWWFTAAANTTPGQTGEKTQRQAPGCAGAEGPSPQPWGRKGENVALELLRARPALVRHHPLSSPGSRGALTLRQSEERSQTCRRGQRGGTRRVAT